MESFPLSNVIVSPAFEPSLSVPFSKTSPGPIVGFVSGVIRVEVFAFSVKPFVAVAAVPQRLQDAGRTLGVQRGSRFFRIDLPLMTPGLGAAAGLVILSTMKELPITLLISPLGFSTLATRIFSSFEDAFVTEAGIMALVLVLISFFLTWFLIIRKADHF